MKSTYQNQQEHSAFYSFTFKLNRIRQQEQFRLNNLEKFERLSLRERQILQYVAQGNCNHQIARLLFISKNTVEQHRKNIKKKLQAKNTITLYQYALAYNLI